MGFFSNIIRDSRITENTLPIAEGSAFGVEKAQLISERSTVEDEEIRPSGFSVDNESVREIREESAGFSVTARDDQLQAETVAPQVVSLSPSQYIPAVELEKVRVEESATPLETREQTESESDWNVSDQTRMTRTYSLYGDDSFGISVVQVSSSVSSIRESSSKSAVSRAGKTVVENQGRQQEGDIRAGLTTPPVSSKQNSTGRSGKTNKQTSVAGEHQTAAAASQEDPTFRIESEPARKNPDTGPSLRTGSSRNQDPAAFVESHQIKARPGPPANDVPGDQPLSPGNGFLDPGKRKPQPDHCWSLAGLRNPSSSLRNDREKLLSKGMQHTGEPHVQIGTIEVVVLVPAKPDLASRSEERVQPDPASRNYLRNF